MLFRMSAPYPQLFFTFFIVIDPIGIVPLFLSTVSHLAPPERKRIAGAAVSVAFFVLSVFILAGRFILSFFGISPGAFYIAGGVLFFMIAMDMLFGRSKRTKTSAEEDAEDSTSLAVFPLAIPMISGPGAITTIMLYSADSTSWASITPMLFAVIVPVLACVYLAMRMSGLILRMLGKTGVSVVERMMGLILSGLSIQFIVQGLGKLGILAA